MGKSNEANNFSSEVREHAVHLVHENRNVYPYLQAAVKSITPKIGCEPQTLHEWRKRAEIDTGDREGLTTSEIERLRALEGENKELRQASEILETASAFFAQA